MINSFVINIIINTRYVPQYTILIDKINTENFETAFFTLSFFRPKFSENNVITVSSSTMTL